MYNNPHLKRSADVSQSSERTFKHQRCELSDGGTDPHQLQNSHKVQSFRKLVNEKDVGITEYVNNFSGFSATVKERYSDFLVNEVDLDGNIVRLTHFIEPVDVETEVRWDVISEEDLKLIEELKQGLRKQVLINVTSEDKDMRRSIHDLIKKKFSELVSKTEARVNEKYIVVERIADLVTAQAIIDSRQDNSNRNTKGRKRHKPRSVNTSSYPSFDRRCHPHGRGDYTHFVLYKENRDTMDAVNFIAGRTRVPTKKFSYAGTKDKRGKTVQTVVAYRLPAAELLALNNTATFMKIGNIEYKNTSLKLGDLSGNHFVVILRQLEGDLSQIDECISSFASQGFVNYYGLQRFGTRAVPTHHIGRALIQNKWKKAIDLILQPKTGVSGERENNAELSEACHLYLETGDAEIACKNLSKKSRFSIEGRLLLGLHSCKDNDFIGALNRIPRNTRLMYLHSYQSYIWNKVVSRRIKEIGLKPQVGDLITSEAVDVSEVINMQQENATMFDQIEKSMLDNSCNEVNSERSETSINIETSEPAEENELLQTKLDPEILDEDQIGNKTIFDIVLPLVGHSIKYPNNQTKVWYEEYLKEDGLNINSFSSRVKAYSLGGAYRKLIVKPKDTKYEILHYTDPTLPLALSDYDIMMENRLSMPFSHEGENVKKALKLEFTLPSSSYATMAIREVLKMEDVDS